MTNADAALLTPPDGWLIQFEVLPDARRLLQSVTGACAGADVMWALTRLRGVNMYAHPDDWGTKHRPPPG